jgi:hypothetical protein
MKPTPPISSHLVALTALSLMALSSLTGCKLDGNFKGLFGSARSQKWEYKVIYFDRDSYKKFEEELRGAGEEGWQYAGPLCNDGVNAQFVAFRRPK